MKNKHNYWLLLAILALAFMFRFYRLGEVPQGLHHDEISQAYNAFSISRTGLDRFGEFLPVLFRSFGSFQPPIYTYLTTIPVIIFGNTIFSARFVSALFGVLSVFVTYLVVSLLVKEKYKYQLSLVVSLVVALSPWAIHFSRRAVEANVGITLFLIFFYFLIRSLKNAKFLVPSLIFLGLSTHAYYSERLIAVIFIPVFMFLFRKYYLDNKRWLVMGLVAFAITLFPHIHSITSGAFFARFNQVGTGNSIFVVEFIKHFINYFSPKYLFGDVSNDISRVAPNMGMFYSWLIVPFFAGLYFITKVIDKKYLIVLAYLTFVSLVPASLTGDEFYPLRILEFLWIISVIISVGIFELGSLIKNRLIRWVIMISLIFYSVFSFYLTYFVFYQNETTEHLGNRYLELSNKLNDYENYKVIIDSPRDPAIGLRIAYFRGYNPELMQKMLQSQMGNSYYQIEKESSENYKFDNIETRSINWGLERCSQNTILVGDQLSFSEAQIKEHNLKKEFEIQGLNNKVFLYGYSTNPDKNCKAI